MERLVGAAIDIAFERRVEPAHAVAQQARAIAETCHAIAARFHRGGKLVVFGNGGSSTDAEHIAVEFMHPVIVGKHALPAICLTADVATLTGVAGETGLAEVFAHQVSLVADPTDIALGVSADGGCPGVLRGLEAAHELGMLTVALSGGDGGALSRSPAVDHVLVAPSDDPRVVKEIHVTIYHILWELVHVFLEQPGVLDTGLVVA